MGDGALGGQPAFDEGRGRRRLRDPVGADAAGIPGTDGRDDAQLCGHDVETLRAIFTNPVHLPAATRAHQGVGLDDLLDPRQALGKIAAIALGPRRLAARRVVRSSLLVPLRLDLGHRRLEVLEGELPVVRVELLGLLAVHDVVELGDEVLEALDDFPEAGRLAEQCGNSVALVIGDGREVDLGGSSHGARIPRTDWNRAPIRPQRGIRPQPGSGLPAPGRRYSPSQRTAPRTAPGSASSRRPEWSATRSSSPPDASRPSPARSRPRTGSSAGPPAWPGRRTPCR
jgi:hypothetical protein